MKKLIIAFGSAAMAGLLAVIILLTGGGPAQKPSLAGTTNVDQIGIGDATLGFKKLSLAAGEQAVFAQNRTSSAIVIYNAMNIVGGKSTTTLYYAAGTSTAGSFTGGAGLSVWNDGGITATNTAQDTIIEGDAPYAGILGFHAVATSSIATTSAMHDAWQNEMQEPGAGSMVVQPLEYVWFLRVTGDQDSRGPGAWCDPTGGDRADSASQTPNVCESATSTQHSPADLLVEFIATSTINNFTP